MDVTSLFIEPDFFSSGEFDATRIKKVANKRTSSSSSSVSTGSSLKERKETKEEAKYSWMNIKETKTKYEWVPKVNTCINQLLPTNMTISASLHLQDVIERFVDNSIMNLLDENIEEINNLGDDFGVEILAAWLNTTTDIIQSDFKLLTFSQEIQECYNLNNEDDNDNLYLAITCIVIIKFLEEVTNKMLDSESQNMYVSLYHLLYVEETDVRFSMLRCGHIENGLIPAEVNIDGFTVDKLRLGLAEFIKDSYDQHPFLEDGVLALLAGSSSIITMSKESSILTYDLCVALGQDYVLGDKELFFILHKYILYLTFENVQSLLRDSKNKYWTITVVLDALNQAAITYRSKLALLK